MLYSEKEERGRHFTLALRAVIPLLLLVSIVIYSTFLKGEIVSLNLENKILIAALTFISVYFTYFFIARSAEETLLDQTTHLFTEKAFVDKLEKYSPDAMVLFLVDNLASINENYSSEEVDIMLYGVVKKLNRTFESHHLKHILMARRHGAEFLIALKSDAKEIDTILKEFIANHETVNKIELDYRYSIATNTDEDFTHTLQQLKSLLPTDTPSEEDGEEEKSAISDTKELSKIENQVLSAMQTGSLLLSFRPLLNLSTGRVDIYEIAVKLRSPESEPLLPRTYLPIINRLGMGRKYDLILLKHLIELLPLIDNDISFTFNISPFSLRDKEFQDHFFELLEESGIDAPRLIIQLYERKTHHNLSGYLKTLKRIRSWGVRICIDNFGSSNASMEYMKHFKFDMIQFDRDYVTKLHEKTSFAMLESLVAMSQELGITTVAKWVDKEEQKKKLSLMGIDYLQGFGIGKPVDEFRLIEKYNKG
ncbi:MAG TPA: GGDEF domain-containing protein [Epsilonproteobacteria bacterium]|nr:GGDEF domain-containing protein [Campylobacterota bacterium]